MKVIALGVIIQIAHQITAPHQAGCGGALNSSANSQGLQVYLDIIERKIREVVSRTRTMTVGGQLQARH